MATEVKSISEEAQQATATGAVNENNLIETQKENSESNEKKLNSESKVKVKSGEGMKSKESNSKERMKSKERAKSAQRLKSIKDLRKASEEMELKYGAIHVIQLFVPISICLLMVVLTVRLVPYYAQEEKQRLIYAPFSEDVEDNKDKLLRGLGNALIMMTMVVITTFLIIILYKYRFYKLIHGWLFMSSLVILSFFTLTYVSEVLRHIEIPMDYITVFSITWNVCAVGMIAIHWKGPLRLQQAYLIYVSALLALVFIKFLPSWTTWIVLGLLVVWDLVAVLCPQGPLRMLVELAKERNEPIFPAMIYSSIIHIQILQQVDKLNSSPNALKSKEDASKEQHKELKDVKTKTSLTHYSTSSSTPSDDKIAAGVKLGLGDFIFYSVLVGKASKQNDWNTTIACFIAILVGLSLTLMLLAIFRKALPALPISLTFGLIFLSCTSTFVQPFADTLSYSQVNI